MRTQVKRTYHFESGHFLPHVPEGHKCKRQHGHNYQMDVVVEGHELQKGFVIDFWDLDKAVLPIVERVDHRNLNEVKGLENPTAENIAYWFYQEISEVLCEFADEFEVVSISIHETKDAVATVIFETNRVPR